MAVQGLFLDGSAGYCELFKTGHNYPLYLVLRPFVFRYSSIPRHYLLSQEKRSCEDILESGVSLAL